MENSSSILDRVMEQKTAQGVTAPEELLKRAIAANLSEREQEILHLRFGLGKKAHTLDAIGKKFFITRERVRQITKQAILKLNKIKGDIEELKMLDRQLKEILERSGGLRAHDSLGHEFYQVAPNDTQLAALRFFIEHLSDYLEPTGVGTGSDEAWQLVGVPAELHGDLLEVVKEVLTKLEEPHTLDALHEQLAEHDGYANWQKQFVDKHAREHDDVDWLQVLEAYLEVAEELKQNPFSEWGLGHWSTVNPRRISDKIHLVLKRHGKPLHFEKITKLINDHGFDRKRAHAPTVHNELILNDNFVLIGRGIYALKDWGYTSGTVADVLAQVLRDAEEPISKEELIEAVLKQRQVKEGTIMLALNDKDRFQRHNDGRYSVPLDSATRAT